MKYIESLREGERINEIYLCKVKQAAMTKAGKPYDNVILQKKPEPGIEIESNLFYLPTDENNIAWKAAQMLMDEFQLPGGIKISLEKRIPVAAGMAGGSSNAAAVLYGMNRMYQLGLDQKALMDRGVKLGADVPYCIMRGTVLAEGIGEKLTPLPPMPKYSLPIPRLTPLLLI